MQTQALERRVMKTKRIQPAGRGVSSEPRPAGGKLTSPNDVAKLGEGLTRPSVLLLLLLYGLCDPRRVWMPRILPRLSALVLPFLR